MASGDGALRSGLVSRFALTNTTTKTTTGPYATLGAAQSATIRHVEPDDDWIIMEMAGDTGSGTLVDRGTGPLDEYDLEPDPLTDADLEFLGRVSYTLGNNTLNGKEKDLVLPKLVAFLQAGHRPNADLLEEHLVVLGKREKVAKQVRQMYEGLLAGKGYRKTTGVVVRL